MGDATFSKSDDGKTLVVNRSFDAPLARVWEAWTTQEILEKWWAPRPWQAVTKSFDFREGGHWHYYMLGPAGERHWCWVDYLTIEPLKCITARDAFCDEQGVANPGMPRNHWRNEFSEVDGVTHVVARLDFESPEDLDRIVEMGFKEGFSMGLAQLEELLGG